MANAPKIPIEPGVIRRLVQAGRYLVRGDTSWMGPGTAPTPVPTPPPEQARTFDYPTAANTVVPPRTAEPTTFAQLRALADAHDLVRLCIETRKDQMQKLQWRLVRKDGVDLAEGEAQPLHDLLAKPDRRRIWGDWLRMLLEEVLVVDATAINPQRMRGGGLYALRLIKGDTITVKIDGYGDVPLPTDPDPLAYQQTIKGVPFADFTTNELLYAPRNVRVGRLYGYSPVEQIILTVNIALRRQAHQLAYYTDGNIPDVLLSVPDTWNPDQIARFQKMWDALFVGTQGVTTSAGAKFVPGGMKAEMLKKAPLFDEGDEWLARVVTYAFSLPPTPFTKQTNRATAETVQAAALQEGLAPLMTFVRDLMNRILTDYAGATAYEFQWKTEDDVDAFTQAQIDQIHLGGATGQGLKVRTVDEVRLDRGFGAAPADLAELNAPTPPPTIAPPPPGAPPAAPPTDPAQKLRKQLRALRGASY